jgi:hypothetical protein
MITKRPRSFSCAALLSLTAFGVVGASQVAQSAVLYNTEQVSQSYNGAPTNGDSQDTAISGDGRFVAFVSGASNLVPGDTNNSADVFVRDRATATTSRVSVSSTGAQTTGVIGTEIDISQDGRYVAFVSTAAGLVPGDTDGVSDLFVHDRTTGVTTLESLTPDGKNTDASPAWTSISGDGTKVAFHAGGPEFGTTNTIWVRNRVTGTVTAAVRNLNHVVVGGWDPSLSFDGRYLAFITSEANMVTQPVTNPFFTDVYVTDLVTGVITLVSKTPAGGAATNASSDPDISNDGRLVAFESAAPNLIAGDTNGRPDAFVRDLTTGITTRVSLSSTGAQLNSSANTAQQVAINADGTRVAFASLSPNVTPTADTNNSTDIFVRDLAAGTTTAASVTNGGQFRPGVADRPAIAADGNHVAFKFSSDELVLGTNDFDNTFVRSRNPDTTPPQVTVTVSPANPDGANGWYITAPSVTVTAADDRDNAPAVEVSADGATWKPYTGPITVTEDGVHTVAARVTDAAGNVSDTSTVNIRVDRTAPVVSLANGPAGTVGYGQVPAAPTCLGSDATSGLNECTISGYNTAVGTHTLTATAKDVAGNTANAQRDYIVAKADQTITLMAAGAATFGDPDLTISATATSGLPVTVTATGACTLSGMSLHLSGAGNCTIHASQPGDGNYNTAPDVEAVTAIGRAHQTITFPVPPAATFGATDFPLTATASSGLPVSYASAGSCTVTGNVVHILGAGDCTLTASQAGNADYNPADDVTVKVAVAKAAQTITYGPTEDKRYGVAPFSTTGTATSGLPVFIQADGSCSIAGGVVTLTGAGSCTLTATQPGSDDYLPAAPVAHTFRIAKADQTITVQASDAAAFGDPDIEVAATATSGLTVTLAASGACTLAGTSLHLTGAGDCTVTAHQAGNANYEPASATRTFAIGRAEQSITFPAPADKTFGDADFEATPAASSGLPVTINATGSCTAAGTTIHIVSAGPCILTASQPGNNNVNPADDVTVTVNIAKAGQTITFAAISDKLLGHPDFTVTPTASSGLPVVLTAAGGCTTSNGTVHLVAAGNCALTATQAGDGNYNPAPVVSRTFQVGGYTLKGFYQPIDMSAINTAKAGSAVPVKFEIYQEATELTSLNEVTSITYASIPPNPTSPTDEIETLAPGANALKYDSTTGQYQYNWKTPTTPGNYRLTVKARDGSTLNADFRLR